METVGSTVVVCRILDSKLATIVHEAKYLVAFTGAGVSTLSGIPDFRGKSGLYNNPDYHRIFDLDLFLEDPSFYYRACQKLFYEAHDVRSSLVHNVLATLEAEGKLKAIITQNIDRLHQQAGSKRVIEVHGSPEVHRCLVCGVRYSFDEIQARVLAGEIPPRCGCSGVIKPEITFFGEELPQGAIDAAYAEAAQADVMLVLGTSLTVYPAAWIPQRCRARGGQIVIVNDQATDQDNMAALRLWSLEQAFS